MWPFKQSEGKLKERAYKEFDKLKNESIKGQVAAVMIMAHTFDFLKKKVSEPFNLLLEDAKHQFPDMPAIQGFQLLQLGPPRETMDVNDIPLVPVQFETAKAALNLLIKLIYQQSKER